MPKTKYRVRTRDKDGNLVVFNPGDDVSKLDKAALEDLKASGQLYEKSDVKEAEKSEEELTVAQKAAKAAEEQKQQQQQQQQQSS